ncbi:MAG: tRNA pseudouridine(13) synthase TruD [Isosphaeraceae bacterium]|nr:tRNA pseudouridine(13) synthase TruD [Isosphaeraceae bacterium]
MKVKRTPGDFQVEELTDVVPADRGRFTFYRLEKTGIGTFEALETVRRRWNLSERQVSYGGLKDRHAQTLQYLTILDGPDHPLETESFLLEPLGRLSFAYGPPNFRGNRFTITLRDLSPRAIEQARASLASLPSDGVPNYFDDQRFGSVGFGGGFIARAWLLGEPETALRLAIAEPTESDRGESKLEKAILREHWGDWATVKAKLSRSHARSLATYLVDHPTDFRGAFARLRRDLRSIYFSAYQSHLWNRILGRWIERNSRPDQRAEFDFKVATLPIPIGLDPLDASTLSSTRIPLPSSRNPLPVEPLGAICREVLAEEGLVWEEFRVRKLEDVFFSKGDRAAIFHADRLHHTAGADELYPGRRKLTLGFELPKGAYATLVIKRITDAARPSEAPSNPSDHRAE